MTTPKEMGWTICRKVWFCFEDNFCKFVIHVLLHNWNDSANWMDGESFFSHETGAFTPQLRKNTSLYWSIEHHTFGCLDRNFCSIVRFFDSKFYLFFIHIRSRKNIKHSADVNAYVSLESNNLFDSDLHIAVHVRLKCSTIGHNNTRIIQESMHPIGKRLCFEMFMLPDNVRVCDECLDAIVGPHVLRRNGLYVWINDRK